jgi:monovalent cation/hydrogen antiporter
VPDFELILLLLVIVAVLVTVARRVRIAYPILLVIGGIVLGLAPGVPEVQLDPQLVFVVFLPPLIFAAAWQTPVRDLRENLPKVLLLSVGLVIFTVVVVGVVADALIPGLGIAAAFVLGAIVSPSDALAATTVLERPDVPRRIRAFLEEESLLNDATALTLYRTGIVATLSGAFVATNAVGSFGLAAFGGIAVGVVVGLVAALLWSRLFDPPVEVSLSIVIPYAAYLPAEQLGASGVIATVTAGLILGYRSSRILSSETRLVASSVWEILTFVLNGFAFLLIGLELRTILAGSLPPLPDLLRAILGVTLATIAARFVWVYGSLWLIPAFRRFRGEAVPPMGRAVPLIVSWAGMRGALSLAAALALPIDFPDRNLIVLLTFAVIAATLLGQGLTLPLLLRSVDLPTGSVDLEEEALARARATDAALAKLERLRDHWPDHLPLIENLEDRYRHQLEHFPSQDGDGRVSVDPEREQERDEHHAIANAVIAAQRETLIGLRDVGEIRDTVLRRIERELDLEEARVEAEL